MLAAWRLCVLWLSFAFILGGGPYASQAGWMTAFSPRRTAHPGGVGLILRSANIHKQMQTILPCASLGRQMTTTFSFLLDSTPILGVGGRGGGDDFASVAGLMWGFSLKRTVLPAWVWRNLGSAEIDSKVEKSGIVIFFNVLQSIRFRRSRIFIKNGL